MSDAYECATRSKLKLKSDSGIKKKKRKNKDTEKQKEKNEHALMNSVQDEKIQQKKDLTFKDQRSFITKAEIAFKQQQEKMRNKRIMERASTTHKERVEKFNEHLDTLTEHFDIPKVSWTK